MAAASPPPEAAAGTARVGLLYDERMCAHATPDGEDQPENPERLRAIWRKLNDEGVVSRYGPIALVAALLPGSRIALFWYLLLVGTGESCATVLVFAPLSNRLRGAVEPLLLCTFVDHQVDPVSSYPRVAWKCR
jgi:hypothetical protein